ncbi:MAG: hypothetical protein MK171_05310 [Pirellulales bacterium]|nr:hypothetical protein [Pirellulales bacterium]
MNFLSRKLMLLAAVAVSNLLTPTARAEPSDQGGSVPDVVVLKNGNLLRGKVLRLDDHYRVEVPGGELLVRIEQVEMICQSLEEVYQKRRASRVVSSADTHLELARWCMRFELHAHAGRELDDARAIDPDHQRIPFMERQLAQLIKLAARAQRLAAVPAKANASQEWEGEVEPAPAETGDLEKAPKWARALFVRQVQPVLVQSCATSGCHQPEASDGLYPLDRLAVEGAGHPEVTLRNLSATLSQIDWETPEQSRLLQQALSAHGGADGKQWRTLPPHKLALLQMWVEQMALAQKKSVTEALAVEPRETKTLESVPSATRPVAEPIQLTGYQQGDPFDARAFNDRYAAVSASPSAPEPPTLRDSHLPAAADQPDPARLDPWGHLIPHHLAIPPDSGATVQSRE